MLLEASVLVPLGPVPVPELFCQCGTGTTSPLHNGYRYPLLVPVPLAGSAQKMADFVISLPFFFNKPLQILPTSKLTMESIQNNSKSGLGSIETSFSQVGLFPKIKIIKGEVRVLFPYLESLPIFSSKLLDHKESRTWEETQPKLDYSLALALFSLFSYLLLQKQDCSK